MPKLKDKYPTEVAEILDIPKEKYDETKDDDKDLKKLKTAHNDKVIERAIVASRKDKKRENLDKNKNKMRIKQ